jgi:hypothetical protein
MIGHMTHIIGEACCSVAEAGNFKWGVSYYFVIVLQ